MSSYKRNEVDFLSSAKARGRRLRALRSLAGLSRKDMLDRYDISTSTLQAWDEGKGHGVTQKGARRVIEALHNEGVHCSVDWLLHGIGKGPIMTDQIYASDEIADSELYAERATVQTSSYSLSNEIIAFRRNTFNAIDFSIHDDGMLPYYRISDLVAGSRRLNNDINNLIGTNCIVEPANGETLVRRLRQSNKPGHFTLMCINPETTVEYPTLYDVELISAAPITWHRRVEQ